MLKMIIFLYEYLLLLTWLCSCKLGFVPFTTVGALWFFLSVIPSVVNYQGVDSAPAPASAGFVQSCKFLQPSHSRSPFLYSLGGCKVSLIFLEVAPEARQLGVWFFSFPCLLGFFFRSVSVCFVSGFPFLPQFPDWQGLQSDNLTRRNILALSCSFPAIWSPGWISFLCPLPSSNKTILQFLQIIRAKPCEPNLSGAKADS